MAEKMYMVLEGQRYLGKHRMYYGKGEMGRRENDIFPEVELFGNPDNLKISLNGADDDIRMKMDEDGKEIKGSEFIAILGKEPKIELIKAPEKKGKGKKK